MSKFSLNATINPSTNKVLFVEADSQFIDVLLSFFTLPLGKILTLLNRHYPDNLPTIGSLTTLHNSLLANADASHFWRSTEGKQMLLNPRNALADECQKLKLNIDDTPTFKFYMCKNFHCMYSWYGASNLEICMYSEIGYGKCRCGEDMNEEIHVDVDDDQESKVKVVCEDYGGVFVRERVGFLITDDLWIYPNSWMFYVNCLSSLGLTDTEGLEQRTVPFGLPEIMDLLKRSLFSRTPLTDVILNHGSPTMIESFAAKYEANLQPHKDCKEEATSELNKSILVKAMLQKSTKKLLFVQSKPDFVDFLFSLLTIPLGSAASLFVKGYDGDHNWCISNLYRSISDLDGKEHFVKPEMKDLFLDLPLHPSYLSDVQVLPLKERDCPKLYYYKNECAGTRYLTRDHRYKRQRLVSLKDLKGGSSYLRNTGTFLVRDDLAVSRWTLASSIALLSEMKVPFHDVEEVEITVGVKEGLGILEASLSSKVALANGLRVKIGRKVEESKNDDDV